MFLSKVINILRERPILAFLIFFNIFCAPVKAQEFFQLMEEENVKIKKIERLGKRYFKNQDKGKGSGYKLYMRNLYWAKRNTDANGRLIRDDKVLDESEKYQKSWQNNVILPQKMGKEAVVGQS